MNRANQYGINAPMASREVNSSQPGFVEAPGTSRAFSCTARFHDQVGELEIRTDGAVSFSPLGMSAPAKSACAACVPTPQSHFSAGDVVGATAADGSAALLVWHCPTQAGPCGKVKRALKKSAPFVCDDAATAATAVAAVRKAAVRLDGGGAAAAAEGVAPGASVFVVVNPKSGSGKSVAVAKEVRAMMAAAGVAVNVTHTTCAGDASSIVAEKLSTSYAAVMAIGGDGTVSEVVQGMLRCGEWEALLRLPLCHVPGGSGNGLAASCGLWNPVAAVHALLKGSTAPLDAATVYQPSQRKSMLAFLCINFAFIATVDIGTESWRHVFGGERFTVGALKELVKMTTHEMRVAWVSQAALASVRERCAADADSKQGSLAAVCGRDRGPPTPILDELGPAPPALSDPSAWPQGWSHVHKKDVTFFAAAGPKWQASDFQLNPRGDQSDGLWDITTNTTKLSRGQGLDLLLKAAEGKHRDASYLDVHHVAAFAIEPLSKGTWLTCDGEVLAYEPIFVEVHRALLNVTTAPIV